MFWSKRPSATEQLIAVIREQQTQQAAVHAAMLNAMSKQAELVQGYLKLFTTPGEPVVRVMTDADEARLEIERNVDAPAAHVAVEMDEWLRGFDQDMTRIKKELN